MTSAQTVGREAVRDFVEHEHQELEAGIDGIHVLGERLVTLPVDQRAASIQKVLHWVEADLKPHMAWEETWLFPQLDARARTPWATRLVRFDHQQIAAQAERLHAHAAFGSHYPPQDTVAIAADLAGLEALLRANVEREERFLLPLLEPEVERWAPEWRD
jgi:iron-sulfur cluster repair protein YtfE (RIC family)